MDNPLIGETITAVFLAEDRTAIRFDCMDGSTIVVHVDADCCSQTWVESFDNVEALLGGTVTDVSDVDMPELEYDHEKFDCLAFYGCRIVTDKGHCTIDYRNDSNGYYGGSLAWPGESFYGGAFGQNRSTERWVPVSTEPPAVRDVRHGE